MNLNIPEPYTEPPDGPDIFVSCAICDSMQIYEDMTLVVRHPIDDHKSVWLCDDCRRIIINDARPAHTNCEFCDDDFPLYVATVNNMSVYVCDDCYEKIEKINGRSNTKES